jgi:nucleoid-associated protein EbfC
MKDLGGLMKTMQQMQSKIGDAQKRMEKIESEGSAGAGMVRITANGEGKVLAIKIDPTLCVPEDVEILEDLVKAAFEDARRKVEAQRGDMEKDLIGGLPLPPGFKMPF